jgi:predicted transposase YdaD
MHLDLINEVPLDFGPHKHDRFFRYAMQHKELAIELIRFALPAELCAVLDFDTLTHAEESFLDDTLKQHFTDICYSCLTKDRKPVKITIIIEHKSRIPLKGTIIEQLHRYTGNVWANDIRQERPLSVPLPILIHQGKTKLKQESTASYFEGIPEYLTRFIPKFDYVLVDLSQLDDEQIAQINNIMLYRFLLALKGAKDAIFLEQHIEKLVIFAPESTESEIVMKLHLICIAYLIDTSNTFYQKLKTMGTPEAKLPASKKQKKSSNLLLQLVNEGIEKGIQLGIPQGREMGIEKGKEIGKEIGRREGEKIGMEKGVQKTILAFLKKTPQISDEEAAELFEVPLVDIKNLRSQIQP